jgi:CTP:molybdopterin cytidylyltransferase MocA
MSQHPITSAIVLAGGLGTRLRSAVPDLPKPMAPIAGRPFLAHQLDQWIAHGIRDFVLAVGYRHEAISDYFGAHYRGAAIRYSVEATPLGTGGALLQAASLVATDARFLLLNGDTYFDVALPALADFAVAHDAEAITPGGLLHVVRRHHEGDRRLDLTSLRSLSCRQLSGLGLGRRKCHGLSRRLCLDSRYSFRLHLSLGMRH